MKRQLWICMMIVAVILVLAACTVAQPAASTEANEASSSESSEASSSESSEGGSTTLTAIKVDAIASEGDAAAWGDAPSLTVPTVGSTDDAPGGPEVTIQAVYDDESIAMRFEWADETESVLKNAWTWDGSAFTKNGDEDRVLLAWSIENNPDFASKGCAAACHNMADDSAEWWMGTDSEDLRLDAWHWKAARTNPVGQADDKWWGAQEDPSDPESSRHGDAKDGGGYANNRNEAQDGPAFVNTSNADSQFILTGEEGEVDSSALAEGAIIPGYVVAPAVGSRGDIAANGSWVDGKWVVVLSRPLDTGQDDDVLFTPPKAYPFGLSVVDNGGGLDHTNAPDVLTLEWK